jgi:hypothetical protein
MTGLLTGCFTAEGDMIGDRASRVIRSEQVFAFAEGAYWIRPGGTSSQVCNLLTTEDISDPCDEDTWLRLERTARGNYIVQIAMEHFDSVVPMVWFRSERRGGSQPLYACLLAIDDEGQSNILVEPSQARVRLDRLVRQAKELTKKEDLDRPTMLKLVALYEKALQPHAGGPVNCPVQRTAIDENLLEIVDPG